MQFVSQNLWAMLAVAVTIPLVHCDQQKQEPPASKSGSTATVTMKSKPPVSA